MKHFITALFLLLNTAAIAQTPANLALLRQEIIHYHDSGEYMHEVDIQFQQAKIFLNHYLTSNKTQKPAIVLDIDETVLSNYEALRSQNFNDDETAFIKQITSGNYHAIPAALDLYHYAKEKNVAVFFITGRYENFRASTIKNLHQAGFDGWDGLYLKPVDYHAKSAAPYKTKTRQKIQENGYDIVLNIGDQKSDLRGGFADKTVKLPNPFYFVF